jgi:hypothetical protein
MLSLTSDTAAGAAQPASMTNAATHVLLARTRLNDPANV